MMDNNEKVSFGKHIEMLRKAKEKSLRETAKAIGVSPQFYSEVEKDRRSAFTKERLEKLAEFLMLNEEQTHTLYDIAAQVRTSNDVVVPQDCVDYLVDNPYVVQALRLSKETGAGEKEWQLLLDELKARKG
ncbi:MAG: helix-turn-helix transcriptional regulator [Thermoflexaceae bacterium]|nr:helix-turn-helix transcriptional regulator [Thermoflexaceae bacterium]